MQRAREAEQKRAVDPLPPTLALDYTRLKSGADQAAVRLAEVQHRVGIWQDDMQQAYQQASVHHALKCGAKAVKQGEEMEASKHWPPNLIRECFSLGEIAKEVLVTEVEGWIPRQNCHSVQQVGEFRQRTEAEATWLATLGFAPQGAKLTAQAQRAIARVEELQRHTLTLAKCEDYPRQPRPTASTSVLVLRDEIRQGDELIAALQAIQALNATGKTAYQQAIQGRQSRLKEAIAEREAELGRLYDLKLDGEEAVREAAATVERLRQIFAGLRDEEEINHLANQLQRILADAQSLEAGDVGVERLGEILDLQVAHQLAELRRWLEEEEIEPPPQWDPDEIYRSLVAERVETARRRSADWLRPRLAQERHIQTLDRAGCSSLEQELVNAPGYLADGDRLAVTRLLEAVRGRLGALEEVERAARVATWQRPYLAVGDVSALDRATTETLLRNLDNPPCALIREEQVWQREATSRLTGHLDQIGIDDLIARIACLSQPMRQVLFDRLSQLMTT